MQTLFYVYPANRTHKQQCFEARHFALQPEGVSPCFGHVTTRQEPVRPITNKDHALLSNQSTFLDHVTKRAI